MTEAEMRYRVWCSADIANMGRANVTPLMSTTSKRDANRYAKKIEPDCQSGGRHFVTDGPLGDDPHGD